MVTCKVGVTVELQLSVAGGVLQQSVAVDAGSGVL